jgi:sialate O-acetylesterase
MKRTIKKSRHDVLSVLSIILAASCSLNAQVKVASIFSDHMVIQRNQPVHIWGWAEHSEQGTVTFRGAQRHFVSDSLGRWTVYLPGGSAGGPFDLVIQATNRVEIRDVLVGDVWLASGQSNMQFEMSNRLTNGTAEIAAANVPRIRLMTVDDKFADHPVEDADVSGWSICTPETVRNFSAIAYFFARDISAKEQIPIGIIDSSWGGTPAEAWTSLDALASNPSLMPVFAARANMMDNLNSTERQQQSERRTNQQRNASGQAPLAVPWRPDPNTWNPSSLFNAMIAPLTPFPIQGVIWYQGESNTDGLRAPTYRELFWTMIADWRKQWNQEEMPFLYVQLANFANTDDWPEVREAQRKTLHLRDTGMVVTVDIGETDNIHPADKQDVGHRLALWARDIVYGDSVEDSGPLFTYASPEATGMVVAFTHAEGLHVNGANLTGFEVAGKDKRFFPATGRVDGEKVSVQSSEVSAPRYVRYGWANDPKCNLFNSAGLPASPFSSE